MKQKAQIDIIDVHVPDSDLTPEVEATPAVPPPEPASGTPVGKRGRWIMAATGLAIFVIAALVTLWYFTATSVHKGPQEEQKAVPVAAAAAPEKLPLSNFYVEVQDEQGRARILRCSLILDIDVRERPALLAKEVTIRNRIYKIIARRSAALLLVPDEKKRLKKDITDELNTLLGQNVIKDVYFDQFILL